MYRLVKYGIWRLLFASLAAGNLVACAASEATTSFLRSHLPGLVKGSPNVSTATSEKSLGSKQEGQVTPVEGDDDDMVMAPKTRFLNGLPAHGSYMQVTLGTGSSVPDASAQRLSLRGSYAKGDTGASVAITLARFDDDILSAWAKPVIDAQVSTLIPYSRGTFVARAGVVLPLGNDHNLAALAGAASIVQAPNDAIYVLPSTVATRGSLSWYGENDFVISQLDFGIDVALFGYPDGVHPIVHANGALGIGAKGYFVGAEGSTALAWTGTLSDVHVIGGAIYGTIRETTIGLFAGQQDNATIVRLRTTYDF